MQHILCKYAVQHKNMFMDRGCTYVTHKLHSQRLNNINDATGLIHWNVFFDYRKCKKCVIGCVRLLEHFN